MTKKQTDINNLKNRVTMQDRLADYLTSLTDDDIVELHNEFCSLIQDPDNEIFENDGDFFDMVFGDRIMEAIQAVQFGIYGVTDRWVKFNGLANLESFNNPQDHIYCDELAEFILENQHHFTHFSDLITEIERLEYEIEEETPQQEEKEDL